MRIEPRWLTQLIRRLDGGRLPRSRVTSADRKQTWPKRAAVGGAAFPNP
jgi:hypothetical protein